MNWSKQTCKTNAFSETIVTQTKAMSEDQDKTLNTKGSRPQRNKSFILILHKILKIYETSMGIKKLVHKSTGT